MRRTSPFLLAALAFCACKRAPRPAEAQAAVMMEATGGGPRALLPGATCELPSRLDHDVTIKQDCVADVVVSPLVENGSTLTIEPGVKIRFQAGTFIEIGHRGSRIVAQGTAEKPIVFTSASSSPQRGDWVGLVLDDTIGESSLDHAIIEYAGQPSHGGSGAITVFRTAAGNASKARVAVTNVTFRENDTAAISDAYSRAIFSAFANNGFNHNARALRVGINVLVTLGDANSFEDGIEVLGGTIEGKGMWPKSKAPVLVSEPIFVNGRGDTAAALTIPRGSTIQFAPKTWLEIGTAGPADFAAHGVTFTSAEKTPRAGDWVGLIFGDKTHHASVSESTIEYAGAEEHGGDAAITFVGAKSWEALDVTVSAVSFRHIAQAHFSSNGNGCNKALDPKYGIMWAGILEPCR